MLEYIGANTRDRHEIIAGPHAAEACLFVIVVEVERKQNTTKKMKVTGKRSERYEFGYGTRCSVIR